MEKSANALPIIVRPVDWFVPGDDAVLWLKSLRRSGVVFRGMSSAEYRATIGAGRPIKSTGAFSFAAEGTCFSEDPADAEDYANFGRDDPRRTGHPTYLVAVRETPTMKKWHDGYIKTPDEVPLSNVVGVWEMSADEGAVMATKIRTASDMAARIASRYLQSKRVSLTPEELALVNYWGRAGIGVGSSVPHEILEGLKKLQPKIPPKKTPILYRGMCFGRGTLIAPHGTGLPSGFKSTSYGYLRDMQAPENSVFFRKLIQGLRSWTPSIRSALYYARGGMTAQAQAMGMARNQGCSEELLVRWINPSPNAIILDTRNIEGSLATDAGEILADATHARLVGLGFEKTTMVLEIHGG